MAENLKVSVTYADPVAANAPGRAGGRILVVEDEPAMREFEAFHLQLAGLECTEAATGPEAIERILLDEPDVVLLDILLPGLDGREVLRSIRRSTDVPVILVSALASDADKLLGFELGADDYITKPFCAGELVARVKSLLRRGRNATGDNQSSPVRTEAGDAGGQPGALIVDRETREVFLGGATVVTTRREFDLLAELVAHPRRVFTRAELLAQVWGSSPEWQDPATVTEHVRRLRAKLEPDVRQPRWIQTVRGIGYRFVP